MGTLLRNDFVTQNVYSARVIWMRCCGTKWSVLYSVLMLGSMGRLRATLTLFLFDPRQPHKKDIENSEATVRLMMLHWLSSSPGFYH